MTDAAQAAPAQQTPNPVAPSPVANVAPSTPVITAAPVAPVVEQVATQAAPQVKTETSGAGVDGQAVLATAVQPASNPAPTSLLSTAPTEVPTEAAPTETPAPELQNDTGNQSAEPAPLPVYEAWSMPEGFQVPDEQVGKFNAILGKYESLTQADHTATQQFGQDLVNYHIEMLTNTTQAMKQQEIAAQQARREGWEAEFEKDPKLGMNRRDTTLRAAVDFIDSYGGSKQQVAQLRDALDQTGMGSHPALIRLLANANQVLSEGQPLVGTKPPAPKVGKIQKMYGNTN